MGRYNIHAAKSNFSRLLEEAASGEDVVVCRDGRPVARVVPIRQPGLVLGSGAGDPDVNPCTGDEWWRAMTEEEAEQWIAGR